MASQSTTNYTETSSALAMQIESLKETLTRIASTAVIGDLTATVAHEINNAIFGILNFLELAIEELEPNYPVQEYLQESLNQTERISLLIEQLMCVAQAETAFKDVFDPLEAVQSVVVLYKKRFIRANTEVIQRDADNLPKIFGVKGSFMGIVIDLLDNARRSLEGRENGIVTIETCLTDSGNFLLTIEDDGIGLPDQDVDDLFRPLVSFWDPVSIGLGLTRVKTITEEMGGTVTLKPCSTHAGTIAQMEFPPYLNEGSVI